MESYISIKPYHVKRLLEQKKRMANDLHLEEMEDHIKTKLRSERKFLFLKLKAVTREDVLERMNRNEVEKTIVHIGSDMMWQHISKLEALCHSAELDNRDVHLTLSDNWFLISI